MATPEGSDPQEKVKEIVVVGAWVAPVHSQSALLQLRSSMKRLKF